MGECLPPASPAQPAQGRRRRGQPGCFHLSFTLQGHFGSGRGAALPTNIHRVGAVPLGGDGEQARSPPKMAWGGWRRGNRRAPSDLQVWGVFFHHFQEFCQVPTANPACARARSQCQPGHRIPLDPPTREGARLSPSTKTPEKSHAFLAATTAARPKNNAAGGGTASGIPPRLLRTQGRAAEPRSKGGMGAGGGGTHTRLGRHLLA